MNLPSAFENVAHLEDVMSTPSDALVQDLAQLDGDLLILGVGGKMGPSLARMAKRAAPHKRVLGVARFTEPGLQETLTAQGIECIATDLLSREALTALPEVANVVFMAGRKFGSHGSEWLTWAMNTHLPALVAERYKASRIVAFSTACVYPFVPVSGPGAPESLAPTPVGEYANSCVGRERLFEHFSHQYHTPGRLIRLSYAIDMRYGVLHDLAQQIMLDQPISLSMSHANLIWQGDANERSLRALRHCTPATTALNLSGPKMSIHDAATGLGRRLGRSPQFTGVESATAWLVDCSQADRLWGPPVVSLERLLDWTADWVQRGQPSLNKPTHFEIRDGQY
ncbi:MAG: NAD-dependent epimerase/dehydratase family protein [Burkholderiaceae bacterium]